MNFLKFIAHFFSRSEKYSCIEISYAENFHAYLGKFQVEEIAGWTDC